MKKIINKSIDLGQAIEAHNLRVRYPKSTTKSFIGGIIIGITAWELGGLITDLIINLIK